MRVIWINLYFSSVNAVCKSLASNASHVFVLLLFLADRPHCKLLVCWLSLLVLLLQAGHLAAVQQQRHLM